jgi:hypothetical protein
VLLINFNQTFYRIRIVAGMIFMAIAFTFGKDSLAELAFTAFSF